MLKSYVWGGVGVVVVVAHEILVYAYIAWSDLGCVVF